MNSIEKSVTPLEFYQQANSRTLEALGKYSDEYRFDFCIGDLSICLKFAGPALLSQLTASFDHLKIAPQSKPRITIFAWDSASTGVELPQLPWAQSDLGPHGVVNCCSDGRIMTIFHTGANAINLVDLVSHQGIYWLPSAKVTYYEEASPFRSMLHLLLRSFGYWFIHAAAIGHEQGGVLLVGKSGSGKSTTSLLSLSSSLNLASDDYCFFRNKDADVGQRPTAFSAYSAAKSNWDTLELLPYLAPYQSEYRDGSEEKAVYHLTKMPTQKLLQSFPIKAVVIPTIRNQAHTKVRRATIAEAMLSAMPSTVFQLPFSDSSNVKAIKELLESVPLYSLDLGSDLNEVRDFLERFVMELP